VSKHLRCAGADVKFSTVLGQDELKDFVVLDMASNEITCDAVVSGSVTTQKSVFIASGYRLLKVDKVNNQPISLKTLEHFKKSLSSSKVDAFVFSDFRHGVFTRGTIPALTECLPRGPLRVADSQVASRWGNILDFQDFDLIAPNEREARFALGDQDSVIRPLALDLYCKARCKTLILKLGERGLITYRTPTDSVRSFFTIDSFARDVLDPIGAGDALLAYATLALVATKSRVIASILGAMAAAVACQHEGNNPVSPKDVLLKLDALEKRAPRS